MLSRDICVRRFSKTRLFTAGRILHIVARKKTKAERLVRVFVIFVLMREVSNFYEFTKFNTWRSCLFAFDGN